MNANSPFGDRIIRIRDVVAMTGLSRSSIYMLIKKGAFPVQVKLSLRSSGWFYQEIKNWMEARPRGA
jgi:prophage regulatory protein